MDKANSKEDESTSRRTNARTGGRRGESISTAGVKKRSRTVSTSSDIGQSSSEESVIVSRTAQRTTNRSGLRKEPTPSMKQRSLETEKESKVLKRKRDEFDEDEENLRKERLELNRLRISLDKREKDIDRQARQNQKAASEIDEREKAVAEREAIILSKELNKTSEAEDMLRKLEDNFSCSLCCDIMHVFLSFTSIKWLIKCQFLRACPASLTPSPCGHSFCSFCILRWFFTHLHGECGDWHVVLECPLCRTKLPVTQNEIPRSIITCPFSLNRLADNVLQGHVNLLTAQVEEDQSKTKPKGRGSKKHAQDTDILGWCTGGKHRLEWEERDRKGRTELQSLIANWRILDVDNFLNMKDRMCK
ncbi:hypothetical protein C8Q75DRAFT_754723 [Abortiporus biennis]|nr:hypothetical protein C8Q75DRAFT_754723 [Abortiporus biennis]